VADLDVVALSSINEGTPVALIEAAAGAKPVVATAVGGVASVVDDGVTGRLVAAGDDEAMALRIGDLLADPDTRRRMGAAGRERVRAAYGEARLLSDMRGLYGSLLSP
jgi:glycosyltransferase involved in cell wall biosynthesis